MIIRMGLSCQSIQVCVQGVCAFAIISCYFALSPTIVVQVALDGSLLIQVLLTRSCIVQILDGCLFLLFSQSGQDLGELLEGSCVGSGNQG